AGEPRAKVLADALDRATARFLESNKSPSRKAGEIDNRGSHFYLALYWAQELAQQTEDSGLADRFRGLAAKLAENEDAISARLIEVQGEPVDLRGYYRPDDARASASMRPSEAFSEALAMLG